MMFSQPVTVGMSSTIVAPLQPLRLDIDVAVLERDLRAHRLEPLQVLIDRPRADRAPAGHRHARPPVARDQRPEHEHARAHRLHQVVRRLELGLLLAGRRRDRERRAFVARLDVPAEHAQQLRHRPHVGELRDVLERRRPRRQQRRRQQRQRGVLGAADRDLAGRGARRLRRRSCPYGTCVRSTLTGSTYGGGARIPYFFGVVTGPAGAGAMQAQALRPSSHRSRC